MEVELSPGKFALNIPARSKTSGDLDTTPSLYVSNHFRHEVGTYIFSSAKMAALMGLLNS